MTNNNRGRFFVIFLALFLVNAGTALGWFPEDHTYFTLSEMRKMDTAITRLCAGREAQVMFGNSGADVPVIHYLENKLEGYKGTHSRAIYSRCLELAGSDPDLKCMCYGLGLHIIQDRSAHYGFVPEHIKRFWGSNVMMHPIIERLATDQLLDRLGRNNDPTISVHEIKDKSKHALDLLWTDDKYYLLFEAASGLDMSTDFAAVDAALKGERWADEVYGKEVNLPMFYWLVGFGVLFIGVLFVVVTAFLARNKLAVISYGIGTVIVVIGIILLSSLFMGKSWVWFNYAASATSVVINIDDTTQTVEQTLANTRRFLETEQLLYDGVLVDDASGLDHLNIDGDMITGPLVEAEYGYKYFVFPVAVILILSAIALLWWRMSRG